MKALNYFIIIIFIIYGIACIIGAVLGKGNYLIVIAIVCAGMARFAHQSNKQEERMKNRRRR